MAITDMQLLSFIIVRFSGFVFLNPALGRKNYPAMAKSALVLALSIFAYLFPEISHSMEQEVLIVTPLVYGVLLLKELLVGAVLGFIFEMFFAVVQYAGAVMDFGMGLSMATAYDPQSNVSMSINANLYYLFMLALFFITDSHLVFLRIVLLAGREVPYGNFIVMPGLIWTCLRMFQDCMEMALRMAFPMMAVQLLTEAAVGILMKMVPQIDIFVINIQTKICVGMVLLLLLVSPLGEYIQILLENMLEGAAMALYYFK